MTTPREGPDSRPRIDARAAGAQAPILFWTNDQGATVEVSVHDAGGGGMLTIQVDGMGWTAPLHRWVGGLQALDRAEPAGVQATDPAPYDADQVLVPLVPLIRGSVGSGRHVRRDPEPGDGIAALASVNGPAHYRVEGLPECVDVIERLGLPWHLANAFKYLWRQGRKPGASVVADLRKAAWYVLRHVDTIEAAERGEDPPPPIATKVPPPYWERDE